MYSVKIKSIVRRSFTLLRYLPRPLRNRVVRSQVRFPQVTTTSDEFTIKIAETNEEFAQAFQILHDSYVEANLMKKESSGLRVTKYHTLPSTTIVVVKQGDDVVGTVSLVLDSPMGLPIDAVADISHNRSRFSRICEVSSLAIKKGSDLRRGKIFAPLTVFIHKYCTKVSGVDCLVCVVNESAKMFYEAVLLFDSLEVKKTEYEYVEATEICPMFCNVGNEYFYNMEKTYKGVKAERNYHKLLFDPVPIYREILPLHKFGQAGGTQIRKELVETVITKSEVLLKSLDEPTLSVIQSTYLDSSLYCSLGDYTPKASLNRKNQRFPVYIKGSMTGASKNQILEVNAQELSWGGLSVHSSVEPKENRFKLLLRDRSGLTHEVHVELCWKKPDINKYGFKVVNTEISWYRLNRDLEAFYYPDLAKTNKKSLIKKRSRSKERVA